MKLKSGKRWIESFYIRNIFKWRMSVFKLSRDFALVMWSNDHVALMLVAYYGESVPCLVWCTWALCRWRYNVFNLSQGLTRPPYWRVKQILGWNFLRCVFTVTALVTIDIVIVKIIFLTCHVNSQTMWLKDYVTLWVRAPHSMSSPCQVWCS